MAKEVKQEFWANQLEYLFSCLGYAVGIGNIWRFPYLCYRNGGGAFLVPYLLTLALCGIPLVYLETTLGQFAGAGCVSVFNINPLFKGAGYATVALNVIASAYFSAIMSYPLLYLYHSVSLSAPLPWARCGNAWNTPQCREITGNHSFEATDEGVVTPEHEFFFIRLLRVSPGLGTVGGVVGPVLLCNALCWLVVYLCICNGVKSVGKVVYCTVSFPYAVLAVLLVRGVTLPGAARGIAFYLWPDWQQLANPKVWADAATQIFFSLGPGWGGLVSMASYNRFNYNNQRSSIFIPIANCLTSIWGGLVVFSVLGFMSASTGVPVGRVAAAGPGLAFVTYPAAVTLMPAPRLWAVGFFAMLFFLGIDTLFVTVEAVIAALLGEFPRLRRRRRLFTLAVCALLFCLSVVCTTEVYLGIGYNRQRKSGGLHIVGLLDSHVALACVPAVCLLELAAALRTAGGAGLAPAVRFMTGQRLGRAWRVLLAYVTPAVLLVIGVYSVRGAAGAAGAAVALAPVLCVPAHAAAVLLRAKGSFVQRVRDSCRPSPEWGPTDPETKKRWLEYISTTDGQIPMSSLNNPEDVMLNP